MSSKTPLIRQVSWPLVVPQFLAMAAVIAIVHLLLRPELFLTSMTLGCFIYLTYSIGSRMIIASAHRAGIRLSKRGKFQEAIAKYEKSYQLFRRHKWLDQWRSLVLMSPSAFSYREMALVNIAFCHGQLGNAEQAEDYYRKALQEFPESVMAATSLRMIETFRNNSEEGSQ